MKKIIISGFVVFVLGAVVSPFGAHASYDEAKAAISKVDSASELESLIKVIKEKIKTLKKDKKSELQNLTIDSVTVSLPNGIGSGKDIPVADQKLTVRVKNNEYGHGTKIVGQADYVIYLYEKIGSEEKKIIKAATGVFDIPYANGTTEFDAYIEGGMPFDGSDMEKEYFAEVKIDTKKKVKESSETDNSKRTDVWEVTYHKG